MFFRYFVIISPWKRVGPFIWTNFIPFIQGCFVQSLVEIGSLVLKKIFKNLSIYFCYFVFYLPLKKGRALHFKKFESPSPKDTWAKFGWNWPSDSGEEEENVKSLQHLDDVDQNNDGQIVIRKAHLSLWLRWAKNILKEFSGPVPLSQFQSITKHSWKEFSFSHTKTNTLS